MKISIAYSPDTDDQFMVQALKEKRLDWAEYEFEFVSRDIQELNDEARIGRYDITAISMAAYPEIQDKYLLMPVGSSVGDGFGPVMVTACGHKLSPGQSMANLRIAVPGLRTSAYLAARKIFGEFEAVPVYFMDIARAIHKGDVDAGILIHEMQINCGALDLEKQFDLGAEWQKKFNLPLPLGGNVIRRDLGDNHVRRLTQIFKDSIEDGLQHRASTLSGAISAATAKLDPELGDKYISMYVNHRSLDLQNDVIDALDLLLEQGARMGLYSPIAVRDNIVAI